jgi:GDP-6-deoxy-D-talose 4-dehydrogenase
VHGLSPLPTGNGDQTLHSGSVDLCDAAAVKQVVRHIAPQLVIHLAAVSFVAHSDIDAIYRTNIVGTRNLLAALADLPDSPQSVILASSASVYGRPDHGGLGVGEHTPPHPLSDYAVSKLAMEHMARHWSDRLPLLFTRPFNYTGVGQKESFLIPKIVSHFQRGERVIELGNLDVEREFTDVRTVAHAYRRLLETSGIHDVYNLCNGIGYSLREVLSHMEAIAGYAIDVKVNPRFVRENDIRRLVGDPTRLIDRIGPPEHRYALTDTLRWMFEAD